MQDVDDHIMASSSGSSVAVTNEGIVIMWMRMGMKEYTKRAVNTVKSQ